NFSNLSIQRNPLRMVVNKNGQRLWVNQLSDGEKCLLAMVGDLARRLAIANPTHQTPLDGKGIVLIDEIDLHLHPSWQRMIVPRLRETFSNCQFFISTHSPQVLGEVDPKNIWFLHQDKQSLEISYTKPEQAFGLNSCELLEEYMESNRRNIDVDHRLTEIFSLIDEEKYDEAKVKIECLKKDVHGSIPDLVEAEAMITMLDDKEEPAG
ncbi:MAG: AAA family ATPase, partial [Deltaproteobacteria bacterium]|nr:AAA family ATPase [Deltaproteobacteria bacterium]